MTAVFAMSSIVSVNISEAHGGCGQVHHRPPGEALWALDCTRCADYLRHDPLWSVTAAEIPETYDETKVREDFEKRGAKDKDAILTLAITRIAGIDPALLPESLTRMISGAPLHIPGMNVAGQMVCPSGHAQPAGQKFCGDCGAPMRAPAATAALTASQKPEPPAAKASAPARPPRLRDARLDELQALAKAGGLDETGNRSDLIGRLSAAGVTSNDLVRLRDAVPAGV